MSNPELYVGTNHIRNTVTQGIFAGSTAIKEVRHGVDLVYQFHPYNDNSVLYYLTGENIKTFELPWGVYSLAITGGGGGNSVFAAGGYYWWSIGGSGATWEGTFYNPVTQTVTLYAAGAGGTSYFNLGNTRMITANPSGGTIEVNNTLDIVAVSKSTNGNPGTTSPSSGTTVASTSSYGWGVGNGSPRAGGFRLEFLRRNK